jgi:hypothetical protein
MGNLSPGIPAPFQKGARIALGRSPGGVDQTIPNPVAINRNRWSQSFGNSGRDQSECAEEPDFEYALIDGTIVSVHQKASGARGGLKIRLSDDREVA